MERAATLLSIGAAAAFICTAVFLFGKLTGLHRLDLISYLTFSDFVNLTPATILANGIGFAVWFWNDRQIQGLKTAGSTAPLPRKIRLISIAVLVLGSLALGYFAGWENAVFWVFITTIWALGEVAISKNSDEMLGPGVAPLLNAYLAILFIA